MCNRKYIIMIQSLNYSIHTKQKKTSSHQPRSKKQPADMTQVKKNTTTEKVICLIREKKDTNLRQRLFFILHIHHAKVVFLVLYTYMKWKIIKLRRQKKKDKSNEWKIQKKKNLGNEMKKWFRSAKKISNFDYKICFISQTYFVYLLDFSRKLALLRIVISWYLIYQMILSKVSII